MGKSTWLLYPPLKALTGAEYCGVAGAQKTPLLNCTLRKTTSKVPTEIVWNLTWVINLALK